MLLPLSMPIRRRFQGTIFIKSHAVRGMASPLKSSARPGGRFAAARRDTRAGSLHRRWFAATIALGFLALARSAYAGPEITQVPETSGKAAPPSELIYEGMASYGNYRVFGSAESTKLYTSGVEFDRETRLRLFGARVDFAVEILPVVLLWQPSNADFWGDPLTTNHEIVPGLGVTPAGFRLLWRDGRRLMPYFETKASVLGFTQKALSPQATYENWSFHCTGGMKVRLSAHYDLRLGMISDLHFSNAFVVRSNPALDVMNSDVGLVYHLGNGSRLR